MGFGSRPYAGGMPAVEKRPAVRNSKPRENVCVLQTWTADRFDGFREGGRTSPMNLGAHRQEPNAPYQRSDFVVKALGLPEITQRSLFAEVFGNVLARELGIETFAPALIDIDAEFADDVNQAIRRNHPEKARVGIVIQAGLAAGSETFKTGNLVSASVHSQLTDERVPPALSLYCFDLLTQNPDRATGPKPNCGFVGDRLLAYDFELAFSFLLALQIGPRVPAWKVSEHGIANGHLFRGQLRNSACNFDPFLSLLGDLSDQRLAQLAAMLPPTWDMWTNRVCAHIMEVRDNRTDFALELRRTLA